MVNLKINNIDFEAAEGLTVLDVARSAGIDIPTMCHKDGIPHYSSCMVCMVKDNRTGNFVPSCSALVQNNMDIDTSGEAVISMRKRAIEMLLSEHRAECEAPCKVVCPAGYNIPLMNRLLMSSDFEGAIKLSLGQILTNGLKCIDCQAYCENACRRKKIDLPVSIKSLQIFIANQTGIEVHPDTSPRTKPEKKFVSRIGKIEESEMKQWLKECMDKYDRKREILNQEDAASESGSCMHCDCRAIGDCRLREIADKFSVKDPQGKLVNWNIEKKINKNTGLIFENAKCIKCGLCVRLCEQMEDEPGLCFINRGFVSIISEPLTVEFDDILKTRSKEVVDICPTGALSYKCDLS
jgi:predicted molibdopterin-dependent oxidoreductase YjgC